MRSAMSGPSGRLAAILGRGHIDERRLDEIAAAQVRSPHPQKADLGIGVTPPEATTAEQAHLRECRHCRSLLVGFARTAGVLGGAWSDRPLDRGFAIPERTARVRLARSDRFGRSAGGGVSGRRAVPAAMAVILVAVVATTGFVALRGSGPQSSSSPASSMAGVTASSSSPASSMAGATAQGTPQVTGLIARLPLGQGSTFSWAPDGRHVLVSGESGSIVYDRFGNQTSAYGQFEGWLDATHLISGNGHVAGIDEAYTGGPTSNSWVVANGHGSAAVIVAVPGCVGDPLIDWYKSGGYVKSGEKATPYGWSPDGKLVLLGHLDCTDGGMDAELHGWKGHVDVVDFASSRVLATAPNVRGEMAFNPSSTRLAAQSDQDLEILDIATGRVKTVSGARLLGWADDDRLYCLTSGGSMALVGATAAIPDFGGIIVDWSVPSSAGPTVDVDSTGRAIRIAGENGKVLLDLSSANLVVDANQATGQVISALQQRWWSPDGRMLAVPSSDGTSLALFSVTDLPGDVASALPTPIGSPKAIAEVDRSALPGPVRELVPDAKRNSFWFLGGDTGKPIDLYRYDVATAKLSVTAIDGTVDNENDPRDCLAIAPDGKLWIGAGLDLIVYDPDSGGRTTLTMPASGPDVQVDPKVSQRDPWIAGIAFDGSGNALVARNWVRSLAQVDGSLKVTGRIDISDGFPMTGGLAVAGGRIFVLADPAGGTGFGTGATGKGQLVSTKFQALGLAAVGDRVLAAGTPPGWIDANGWSPMIEPVMASADLVAAGPARVAALYSNATGEAQWRDADGRVSLQGVFREATPPHLSAIAFDAQGRLWAVEANGQSYSLVRLDVGS